jgi:predicted Fe-Mo cluster-binding NifX family protein
MNIGLPSNSQDFLSPLASSFERCNYFVIVDSDKYEVVTSFLNSAQTAARGAECQAAQLLAEQKVNSVITPKIGLIALRVLQNMGIKIYFSIMGTGKDNVLALCQGRLVEIKLGDRLRYTNGKNQMKWDYGENILARC